MAIAEHLDVSAPSPRASFTLVANPNNDTELIMFGGERYTGDRAAFFNDLYVYNVEKRTWNRYDSPNRPPPRSSHAAAVHKNFMYIFGGEFSNPSLSQYRHYRDLWRLDVTDMSWERIDVRGGPSARSGHRMCVVSGKLVVFGGFYDNGTENKYLNDISFMDLMADELKWTKVVTTAVDIVPSPRSGFQWVVSGNEAWLYGGYCKENVSKGKSVSHKDKKKGGSAVEEAMVSRGVMLSDSYKLCGDTMKWQKVKRGGYGPIGRAGFGMVLHKRNAVVFGGVEDDETEEDLDPTFYNDLFALNLDRKKWFPMTLRKKGKKGHRRRKKGKDDGTNEVGTKEKTEGQGSGKQTCEDAGVDEDHDGDKDGDDDDENEIDTEALEQVLLEEEEEAMPCPRFNSAVAIQRNVLYIFGGMIEKGEQEITLDDVWAIDLNKLDGFVEMKGMSAECMEWVASDEEDEDGEDDEGDSDDGVENDGGDAEMEDVDEEERRLRRGRRRQNLQERVWQSAEEERMTPRVNESLKEFFERSKMYWIGEVHEALGESGKNLRRVAFEWARKRYMEIKPTLRELEMLEAELAREEELEKQFEKAQIEQRRGRSRR